MGGKTSENGECAYHSCKKPAIHKCQYCEKYFCEEHQIAKVPSMPEFDMPEFDNPNWNRDEFFDGKGHPCVQYAETLEIKEKEREEKISEFYDRLRLKPIQKPRPTEKIRYYSPAEELRQIQARQEGPKRNTGWKILSVCALLVYIGLFIDNSYYNKSSIPEPFSYAFSTIGFWVSIIILAVFIGLSFRK
ncbi:MAG: hypothetical protein PHH26_07515 [Candidatus Thermoplasmatota archaeon]|nr:hypothetical protein [Candidatus Thermoplasmatota archaeon]